MEYHKDRFEDYSLLVFEANKLIALLPANAKGTEVFSHQGLTYGGLVYQEKLKLEAVVMIFKEVLSFLHFQNINSFFVKPIPIIYQKKPAQELEYALFLAEAKLYRRDTLSVIDMWQKLQFTNSRKSGIDKGIANNLEIREEANLEPFWNQILIPNLNEKHNAKPVHSIEEIMKLKAKFPDNIRQFNVYFENQLIAGTTIFETETVAHSQYISGNELKQQLGSVDFLYDFLIKNVFKHKHYFDFGTSNEQSGRKLNTGLSFWKTSFGASTICQDFYEVETSNFTKLDNVFI